MMLTSSHSVPGLDTWSSLQRPRSTTNGQNRLLLLMGALDAGWHVDQPIYLRPAMGERGRRAYHVILHRPGHVVNLVTVPQTTDVDDLIEREGWTVVSSAY
ncbi:MAG TPA: hypothetical protein PLC98_09210 [Anaerolineales bacterium]|nr:hypothetical protein [Anaerolineales bacterium]